MVFTEKCRLFPLEECRGARVEPGSGQAGARSGESGLIQVAESYQVRLGDSFPALDVVLGDEPAADQGPHKRRRCALHGRLHQVFGLPLGRTGSRESVPRHDVACHQNARWRGNWI